MHGPDLTVVLPAYNGARWLPATLTSLARQEGVALEVIVVDDGSTDDSARIASEHPLGARIVRQPNRGVAVARNHGAALSHAPWVAFVDQDDLWHPQRARVLLDAATSHGAKAVATSETAFAHHGDRAALLAAGDGRAGWNVRWIDGLDDAEELLTIPLTDLGGSHAVERITVERLMQGPAAVTTSFMYDRLAYLSAGGCAPWIRAADDQVLNLCFASTAGDMIRLDVPCLFYRVHPSSTTTVSPLVAPYLTMLLAFRMGRAFPPEVPDSDYLRHLLGGLPDTPLSRSQQVALLTLSTTSSSLRRAVLRWAKQTTRRVIRPRQVV